MAPNDYYDDEDSVEEEEDEVEEDEAPPVKKGRGSKKWKVRYIQRGQKSRGKMTGGE